MTTIITKNGSGAPTAGQLSQGELAVDLTNKELYTKDSGGNVIKVGAQGGSTGTFTDLTATSSFTSPGIDDNATSTAITINSGGTVDYTNNIAVTGSGKQIRVDDTGTNNISAYMTASNTIGGFVASRDAPNSSEVRLEAKGNLGSLMMTGFSGLSTEIQSNSSGNLAFNMNGTQKASLSQAGTFSAEKFVTNGNVKVEGAYPSVDLRDTDAPLGLGTRMVTSSDSFLINTLNSAGSYAQDVYKVNMNANGPTLHTWTTESVGTAMSLTNGGNLGIGTSSPGQALHVQANSTNGFSGSGILRVENTQSTNVSIAFYTTGNDYSIGSNASNRFNVYDVTNASTPFIIEPNCPTGTIYAKTSGNVGIGTSSPSYRLDIQDNPATTGAPQVSISAGANDVDGVLAFPLAGASKGSIVTNKQLSFHTGVSTNTTGEVMRLDTSGNLLVGKTSAGFAIAGCRIQPTGDVRISKTGAASDTMIAFYKNASATSVGTITSTSTATSYNSSSDERLKDNIVDAPAGNIDSIKVRSFDWKVNGEHQEHGFVAQELETVAPYAVTKGETEDDMWSVDYSKLVPMLVKEIQDLKAEVAALKGA